MTLIALRPGEAGHLAVAARRHVAALESVPGLGRAGVEAVELLRRRVDELDRAAKSGQTVAMLVVGDDDGGCNLRVSEAAAVANISVRTLRRRLADGVLPSTRDGRAYLVPASGLVDWIRAGRPRDRRAA